MSHASWRVAVAGLVLACASHVGAQSPSPAQDAPAPPALSAAQQCEVDRVLLQQQVVELRAQLVAAQTQLDRVVLERERTRIEGTLPAHDGYTWDWATGRYVAREGAQRSPGEAQVPR